MERQAKRLSVSHKVLEQSDRITVGPRFVKQYLRNGLFEWNAMIGFVNFDHHVDKTVVNDFYNGLKHSIKSLITEWLLASADGKLTGLNVPVMRCDTVHSHSTTHAVRARSYRYE